jgi:hypothetical protein
VKKLAILKVQKVILTVFTLVTFFLRRFRLESDYARGQNMEEISSWAGATATVSAATKWGRSSPTRCFAHVQNPSSRHVQPLRPPTTSVHRGGERSGEPDSELRLSAPFTLPRWKKRLRFVAIGTHPLLKRPRKQENAKESFGPELQESVGSVLMTESPPSPPYLLGNIEKGKT